MLSKRIKKLPQQWAYVLVGSACLTLILVVYLHYDKEIKRLNKDIEVVALRHKSI